MILGTYHDLVFERLTCDGPVPDDLVIGDTASLGALRPLLTAGDHTQRIDAGDKVLTLMYGGRPVALQWLNRSLHQDRYLGHESRPTLQMAYINQSIVDPDFRNQGLMHRLMEATLPIAHELGITRVRAFVDASNTPMMRVMHGVGFAVISRQHGVRIGPRFTLRLNRRVGPEQRDDV